MPLQPSVITTIADSNNHKPAALTLDALRAELDGQVGWSFEELEYLLLQGEEKEVRLDSIGVTQYGDLWVLNDHRLLCGDSMRLKDVRRLMGSQRAVCVFTDPPYGVSVAAKNRMLNTFQKAGRCLVDIVDDDLIPDDLSSKLKLAFDNVRTDVMADDCTLMVCSPQGGELCMMMMMMRDAKLPPRHVMIWCKNQPTFSMGRLDYDYQHEPILVTWVKKHKNPMLSGTKTSLWKIDKPRESKQHPTMKPVELYVTAYTNHTDVGDVVADVYMGSGTALIAAEKTGRVCYGMEIDPHYVDVALERWATYTKCDPVREDGVKFSELKKAAAATVSNES